MPKLSGKLADAQQPFEEHQAAHLASELYQRTWHGCVGWCWFCLPGLTWYGPQWTEKRCSSSAFHVQDATGDAFAEAN